MPIVPEVAQHLSKICRLCERYRVQRMSIIGSATNGKKFSLETSDVDFLVKFFDEKNENASLNDLATALEEICQRPVELMLENTLKNDLFRKIVEPSKILIYDCSHDCSSNS